MNIYDQGDGGYYDKRFGGPGGLVPPPISQIPEYPRLLGPPVQVGAPRLIGPPVQVGGGVRWLGPPVRVPPPQLPTDSARRRRMALLALQFGLRRTNQLAPRGFVPSNRTYGTL